MIDSASNAQGVTSDNGEFRVQVYDLFTGIEKDIRSHLFTLAEKLGNEDLRAPLYAMTQELAANALKALYKKAYFKFMLEEVGMDDVPYEEWLKLFKTELETHRAENFARLCREKNIHVEVSAVIGDESVIITVINEGTPSEVEWKRLQASISRARELKDFGYIFQDDEEIDSQQEGGGLGIPLIIMSLRGLGIDPDHFCIVTERDTTIARIEIPLRAFLPHQKAKIAVMKRGKRLLSAVWNTFHELGMGFIRFDQSGDVLEVSDSILTFLGLNTDQSDEVANLIPPKFKIDIFHGPQGIRVKQRFESYRIRLKKFQQEGEILFHVSGYLTEEGSINSIWQQVLLPKAGNRLSEGSIFENLQVQNIIKPYIPALVLSKAREAVKNGKNRLPDEVRDLTILFADLIGFTQKAENIETHKVIDLLNISLGVAVRSIEKNGGHIDKFMGDAIMAVFQDPLSAVIAAVEIQNHFDQLNEFRRISNEEPIDLRIGIHTGTVIVGNIGTRDRMDWTAIGDVVNTASRIEKNSLKGAVLISESVFDIIKDQVTTFRTFPLLMKGKQKEMNVYFIESVSFFRDGDNHLLRLSEKN